jgi:hypothetical protein
LRQKIEQQLNIASLRLAYQFLLKKFESPIKLLLVVAKKDLAKSRSLQKRCYSNTHLKDLKVQIEW